MVMFGDDGIPCGRISVILDFQRLLGALLVGTSEVKYNFHFFILVFKRTNVKNRKGAISLGRVMAPSPKIVIN